MTHDSKLNSALCHLIHEAQEMEAFLTLNAPPWSGYGENVANYAKELAGREMSRDDLRLLEDRVGAPYRGTFGSMHDLSFQDARDDELRGHQENLRRAISDVERAFFEHHPDEGRIRRLLIAIEESLIVAKDPRVSGIRAILSQHELDTSELRRVINELNNEPHFRSLMSRIEHELDKS